MSLSLPSLSDFLMSDNSFLLSFVSSSLCNAGEECSTVSEVMFFADGIFFNGIRNSSPKTEPTKDLNQQISVGEWKEDESVFVRGREGYNVVRRERERELKEGSRIRE